VEWGQGGCQHACVCVLKKGGGGHLQVWSSGHAHG
jgi:hypothetical protein